MRASAISASSPLALSKTGLSLIFLQGGMKMQIRIAVDKGRRNNIPLLRRHLDKLDVGLDEFFSEVCRVRRALKNLEGK